MRSGGFVPTSYHEVWLGSWKSKLLLGKWLGVAVKM
jgi:hypothetical protein